MNCSYADNYSSTLPHQWMFTRVKRDLVEAHDILTMPLKNCHSDIKNDEGIRLEDTQVYGVLWSLQTDTITPNQFLSVGKKIRGKREKV